MDLYQCPHCGSHQPAGLEQCRTWKVILPRPEDQEPIRLNPKGRMDRLRDWIMRPAQPDVAFPPETPQPDTPPLEETIHPASGQEKRPSEQAYIPTEERVPDEEVLVSPESSKKNHYFLAVAAGVVLFCLGFWAYMVAENQQTNREIEISAKKYHDLAKEYGPSSSFFQDKSRFNTYKEKIKKQIHRAFHDPYSLRDVAISDIVAFRDMTFLCLEANAKNRMGAYVGLRRVLFVVEKDDIVGPITDENATSICSSMMIHYSPWPEMEGKN
jgi:hypothetical protein